MTREPFPADMLCRAIARRLQIIADQYEEPWDDFREVSRDMQRLIVALLREVATAIDEESRR